MRYSLAGFTAPGGFKASMAKQIAHGSLNLLTAAKRSGAIRTEVLQHQGGRRVLFQTFRKFTDKANTVQRWMVVEENFQAHLLHEAFKSLSTIIEEEDQCTLDVGGKFVVTLMRCCFENIRRASIAIAVFFVPARRRNTEVVIGWRENIDHTGEG